MFVTIYVAAHEHKDTIFLSYFHFNAIYGRC